MTDDRLPMRARATLARWGLGTILAIGAVVLLVKPGGVSKLLGVTLAAAAVTTFVRKDRSSATIVAVVLLAIGAFFLIALLTGNSQWFMDRYAR